MLTNSEFDRRHNVTFTPGSDAELFAMFNVECGGGVDLLEYHTPAVEVEELSPYQQAKAAKLAEYVADGWPGGLSGVVGAWLEDIEGVLSTYLPSDIVCVA